ncbi:hypothetical protein Tco_0231346 [Tanacetum coccineum]|uniref:Uncharacterized protein n=1 Tax=Tanacetum coccineum TaxID=301880 RepID=A0ABQ5FQI6_9ASTR
MGKVNSVLSKQSLAHSQAHSHVINGEAHMECGFCAISTQRTSTMSHQRNDTLAILNCAHFDPTAQDQAQMIRRIKWLRLKDWRARQLKLKGFHLSGLHLFLAHLTKVARAVVTSV